MKYVDLNASMTLPGGVIHGVINPTEYLERFPEFADALPAGARAPGKRHGGRPGP
ncbi:hypothetical protein [Nonomuraea sp. CA-141351]|uniref:hypothetical protein n=1 Tax=Nonomuraea sp. CA-141351 TaxID=3239996 RepID=UPI003D8BD302